MRIQSTCVLLLGLSIQALSQDNLETLSGNAREAMSAGRYSEAVGLYERLVKALPGEPGAKFNLALALDAASRPRDALRNLEQIKGAEAGNPRFWFLLGIQFQKMQQPAKAVDPLERAVQLAPHEFVYRIELADAYLASGDLTRAAATFQALSATRSSDSRVLGGWARAELAMSGEAYEALKQSAPGSSFLLALEALAAVDQGDRAKADGLYRLALAAQPVAPWLAAEQRGLPDAATDAGHPLAHLFHQGDDSAVVARTATVKTPESLYWRARACSNLARAALSRLAALPPSPEAHELAGISLRQSRRWEDSIAEFREALSLAPGDVRLRSELAKSYWLSRRYEETVKLLEQLISHEPDRGGWEFQLGDSLFNLGQPDESLDHLRKAASLSPGDFAIQGMLGRVLLQTGHSQEARPILERAAPHDTDGSIHFQLAAVYRDLGRADLAGQAMRRQKELEQKHSANSPAGSNK